MYTYLHVCTYTWNGMKRGRKLTTFVVPAHLPRVLRHRRRAPHRSLVIRPRRALPSSLLLPPHIQKVIHQPTNQQQPNHTPRGTPRNSPRMALLAVPLLRRPRRRTSTRTRSRPRRRRAGPRSIQIVRRLHGVPHKRGDQIVLWTRPRRTRVALAAAPEGRARGARPEGGAVAAGGVRELAVLAGVEGDGG